MPQENSKTLSIIIPVFNEINFLNLLNKIFNDQNEYFSKKNNLIELSRENTWEINKSKLIELLNEN